MTGRPFSPPLSYRTSSRRYALKLERSEILEGKCHKCKKWVPVESIKDCEVKVCSQYGSRDISDGHH